MIFIHGLDQESGIFAPVIAHLVRAGYPSGCLLALDLDPPGGSNRSAAENQVAPAIERTLADLNEELGARGRPLDRVHIVAHSMGALAARWYATRIRPDRVATLVTTSGANHGTNWECGRPYGAGHREMCPAFARTEQESSLQWGLNGGPGPDIDETPYGAGADARLIPRVPPDGRQSILYITIRAPRDPYIVPNESLLLDGAGDPQLRLPPIPGIVETSPGNFLAAGSAGHDEILGEPAVLELIQRVLEARNRQRAASYPGESGKK